MLNLNKWASEIHENSIEHGWWDDHRDEKEIFALIHSEWSEALEEDRAGRPMVYADDYEGLRRIENIAEMPDGAKPEGVAVELIDGVIRILDYLAFKNVPISRLKERQMQDVTLAQLVCGLHSTTSFAGTEGDVSFLINAIGSVFSWISANGFDPVEIMRIKHDFNTRRPYKHGKRY